MSDETTKPAARTRKAQMPPAQALREALAHYIDVPTLRRLAAAGGDLERALAAPDMPPEVTALITTLATLLRPAPREQIKTPGDVAALLMVEMAWLDQEELRIIHLDTKSRVQSLITLYKGSVHSSIVRVGEVFKEAVRLNSTAIILAHNHPSGDPTPSPEDVLVTRQIIQAGALLDCEVLDHLVVGRGTFISMRERKLAF